MTRLSAEDVRFIAALRRRDERAFSRLVLRYQRRVYNVTYRLLGSEEEARDVAQEVFVSIFQRIDRFRGDSKLSTWIYRIATNHAKNRLKYLARRRNRDQDGLDEFTEEQVAERASTRPPRPDEQVTSQHLEQHLQRCLAALDDDQRTLVVLRDIEGLTYDDLVDITGMKLGTIKSRLHRGRLRLKAAVEAWMTGQNIPKEGSPLVTPQHHDD